VLITGCASPTYVKVGTGYKVNETNIDWKDGSKSDPVVARIEVFKKSGAVTYGVSHSSQWFQGWPVNNELEYAKTEVFIDYTFTIGGK